MLLLIAGYVFAFFLIFFLIVFPLGCLLFAIVERLLGLGSALGLNLVIIIMCVHKVVHFLVLLIAL